MTELIEEILKQIHEIGEEYYSVDHSTGGVSFYEYLARRLVEAGYRLPPELPQDKVEAIATIIHPEYADKFARPECFECAEAEQKAREILSLVHLPELPVLTDEEIVAACGMVSINYRKIAQAQRDQDKKRIEGEE